MVTCSGSIKKHINKHLKNEFSNVRRIDIKAL